MNDGHSKIGALPPPGESDIADALREACGAGPDEVVQVVTPQFVRTAEMQGPSAPPSALEDWNALREMDVIALREMGLHPWDEPDLEGKVLMLFPGEWYPHIPRGFWIEDLNSPVESDAPRRIRPRERELFEPGVTDNDIRFGCLAFGVRVKVNREDGVVEEGK